LHPVQAFYPLLHPSSKLIAKFRANRRDSLQAARRQQLPKLITANETNRSQSQANYLISVSLAVIGSKRITAKGSSPFKVIISIASCESRCAQAKRAQLHRPVRADYPSKPFTAW